MPYLIAGVITYTTTTGRDAARTAITNALGSYTGVATSLPAGVNVSGNAVQVSVLIEDANIVTVRPAFLTAWAGQTRATTGQWVQETKVP